MGTYYTTGATRDDIVREILEPLIDGDHLFASKLVREDGCWILWTVEGGVKDGELYQFIGCYLLSVAGGSWGYKPMDETVGPYYYSVPAGWLERYPCIIPDGKRGYSDKWRARVSGTVLVQTS